MDALKSKGIYLTIPEKWYGELARIANIYGLSKQDIIKQLIGEYLKLLPSVSHEGEKHPCPPTA